MPEGPEVATLAEELNFYLTDRIISRIDIVGGPMSRHGIPSAVQEFSQNLPQKIIEVEYTGKLIIFKCENFWLFSTLGMSGRWSFRNQKHAHIQIHLEHVSKEPLYPDTIYFVDQRCFGTFDATDDETKYLKRRNSIKPGFLGKYLITKEIWNQGIQKNLNKNICKSLMDQHAIIGGIGNYLLSEILHRAKVSPWITWKDISSEKKDSLFKASQELIESSYNHRGASIRNYQSLSEEKGDSSFYFRVYSQEKDEEEFPVVGLKGPHGRTIWISTKFKWSQI